MRTHRNIIKGFVKGKDTAQTKFELIVSNLVEIAATEVKHHYPNKSTGADELNEFLLPQLQRFFSNINLDKLSDKQHQQLFNAFNNWVPNCQSAEQMSGYAAAQQIILFDIVKEPAQRKVDKLDHLCADYEQYLQGRAQVKSNRRFSRAAMKAREKLKMVTDLRAVLHKKDKPEQRLAHFKQRFSHVSKKLQAHRNSSAARFAMAVITLLSGGLAKVISAAFNKKPISSNNFAFWRSHGENVVKQAQRLTR